MVLLDLVLNLRGSDLLPKPINRRDEFLVLMFGDCVGMVGALDDELPMLPLKGIDDQVLVIRWHNGVPL